MTAKRNPRSGTKALPEQEGALGGDAAAGVSPGAPGLAGAPGDTPGQASSMAESVTRHAQNPLTGKYQFLLCGIDSLDLGIYVSWDRLWEQSTLPFLNGLKEKAQGTTGITDETDLGRPYLVLPGGKPPNYRFHLQFHEYHFYLAKSTQYGNSPNVYVSISAAALWHLELSTIMELIHYDLSSFGGTVDRIQPSRVDLCADFRMDNSPSFAFLEEHRVSRSRKVNPYLSGSILETYYCGSTAVPVRVRIYDKGKEVMKSNKQWFRSLWGVDAEANVWRVEFQLRRLVLKQFRVKTLDDLWHYIGAIWEYLTFHWFSLRLPDNEKPERRTFHPWWMDVQECRYRFGESINIKRTFVTDTVEPIEHTLAHIMGRTISIAAQKGIIDRKEAIAHLSDLLIKKSDDEKFASEYQKRVIRLGFRGMLGGSDDE